MEEIKEVIENKELIVRKKISSFFEKIIHFCQYDYNRDRLKKIMYAETPCETKFEEKIKNYLDGFLYLLSNRQNPVTKVLLQKFFYLLLGKEIEEFIALKLATAYFFHSEMGPIEKAMHYHLVVYQTLVSFEERDRFFISLLFLNFVFVKHNIPCVSFFISDLKAYVGCREAYFNGDSAKLWQLLLEVIHKNSFVKKGHFDKIEPLGLAELYQRILEQKSLLEENYQVKHLWVYGSFAKKMARYDSDVDILVRMSLDLTQEEQNENIMELKKLFGKMFHKWIDIHFVYDFVVDDFIKTTTKIKKIF